MSERVLFFAAAVAITAGCQSPAELDNIQKSWKNVPDVCRRGTLLDGDQSIAFEFVGNKATFPGQGWTGTHLARYQEIVHPYSPASQTLTGMQHFIPCSDDAWSISGTTLTYRLTAPPLTVTLELDDSLRRILRWEMLYVVPGLRKHTSGGIEYDAQGRMIRRWEDAGELPEKEFLFTYDGD